MHAHFLHHVINSTQHTRAHFYCIAFVIYSAFQCFFVVAGHPIKDDILIILGIKKVDANLVEHESPVKGAIIKLLQDELGLEVAFAGPKIALDKRINLGGPPGSDPDWQEALGRNRLPTELESSTRRPAVLQRFKVTRKSLDHWLQRRVGATRG